MTRRTAMLKNTDYGGWSNRLAELMINEEAKEKPIAQASRKHTVSQLTRWLQNKKAPVLLEIGCSSGLTLEAMQAFFPKAKIVGTDYDTTIVKKTSRRLPSMDIRQLDVEKCSLPDAMADGIVMVNVLEHLKNDEVAIDQVYRILKPGGVAVIEVPANPDLYDVFDKQVCHFRRYHMPTLVSHLRKAGFEMLDKSHLGVLVYPVFYLMKKRNQNLLDASPERQWQIVSQELKGGGHPLLKFTFAVEAFLRKFMYLPAGIRCLVTCRKPCVH